MDISAITGVILAGGEARRMGGQDKGLVKVADRPMIEYVLDSITPQTGCLIINANRNHDTYMKYGHPVITDEFEGFNGPLAGMASCMRQIVTTYMITMPCDSPFVPKDLVQRLYQSLEQEQADISVAHNGKRIQPVFSLMKTDLLDSLVNYLDRGERKIDRWFQQHAMAVADFSDEPDTFININTPEDITHIESKMQVG